MRLLYSVLAATLFLAGCSHQPRYSMTPVTTHPEGSYTGPSTQDYKFSKDQLGTLKAVTRGSDEPLQAGSERSAPAWYRVEATAEQVAFAKEKAVYDLKDPGSAQFRDMYAISRGLGDDTVCGEINAKNSYGGYVGFRKFFVYSNGSYHISDPDSAIASLPQMVCDKPLKP